MVWQIDLDGSGELNFLEFAEVLTSQKAQGPAHASLMMLERCSELRQLFELFDTVSRTPPRYASDCRVQDGGGELSSSELSNIMARLGRRPAPHELAETIGLLAMTPDSLEDADAEPALSFPGMVAMLAGEKTQAQRALRGQIRSFRRVSVCGSVVVLTVGMCDRRSSCLMQMDLDLLVWPSLPTRSCC